MPATKKNVTFRTLKNYWSIYLLLLPTLILVGTFSYSPALSGIYHSFFRWNGSWINEYVGLQNYKDALNDNIFLDSFGVLGVMVVANLFKMLPAIITAVCIHRMISDKWQYYYRVIFVVPMIIPIWVRLLLWKFFYNPQIGPLNYALNKTGGMGALRFMDSSQHGLPALSNHLMPISGILIDLLFGSIWGLFFFGFVLVLVAQGVSVKERKWFAWFALAVVSIWALFPFGDATATNLAWFILHVILIFGGALLVGEIFRNRLHYPRGVLKWCGSAAMLLGVLALVLQPVLDGALMKTDSVRELAAQQVKPAQWTKTVDRAAASIVTLTEALPENVANRSTIVAELASAREALVSAPPMLPAVEKPVPAPETDNATADDDANEPPPLDSEAVKAEKAEGTVYDFAPLAAKISAARTDVDSALSSLPQGGGQATRVAAEDVKADMAAVVSLIPGGAIHHGPVAEVVTALAGNAWGFVLLGALMFLFAPGVKDNIPLAGFMGAVALIGLILFFVTPALGTSVGFFAAIPSVTMTGGLIVYVVLIVAFAAIFARYLIGKAELTGPEFIKTIGIMVLMGAAVLVIASMVWTDHIGQFETGKPAWLGHQKLVLPAIIFYGFPWVGVFGVLVYLAGLQNISQDVYEAADLDGIGWFRKFTLIEFPLIMTQIRLMLILMTIRVIKQFALILVMTDPEGGPGGAAQVPGLYMFLQAFRYGFAGYGAAIGVILFVIILTLTLINQKFVRVEK